MNILKHLAINNLKMNKKRTISTIIGIILSTALICGTATLVTSIQNTLVQNAINETGYYHFKIESITDNDIEELKTNKKIKNINAVRECGYGILTGSKNENKPYVKLFSIDEDNFKDLKFKLIEGRFPKNSNELIISEHIKTNAEVDLKVGDKVSFDIGKRESFDDIELKNDALYAKDEEKIVDTKNYEFTIVRNYRKTKLLI